MPQRINKVCPKCGRNLPVSRFFTARSEKYSPDGYSPICKDCFYESFSALDPNTFMNMLRALDMPWLPVIYRRCYQKRATLTNPSATAIFGNYLSAIKLNPYISVHFDDSAAYQLSKFSSEPVDDPTSYDLLRPLETPVLPVSQAERLGLYISVDGDLVLPGTSELISTDSESSSTLSFTAEEKQYLANKWGPFYSTEQLISLERMYLEMMEDMDIRTATQKDYLKKMCVVSLRYDESLAASDFDGARKASGMYSAINKEAGFQPIQSQAADAEYLDAVGVLVRMAESPSPIPVWNVEASQDEIDILLKDYKLFVKRLVDNDDTISTRINEAAKALVEQDAILSSGEIDDGEPVATTSIEEIEFPEGNARPESLDGTIDFGSVYDNVDNVTEKTEKEVFKAHNANGSSLKVENADKIKADFKIALGKFSEKMKAQIEAEKTSKE